MGSHKCCDNCLLKPVFECGSKALLDRSDCFKEIIKVVSSRIPNKRVSSDVCSIEVYPQSEAVCFILAYVEL